MVLLKPLRKAVIILILGLLCTLNIVAQNYIINNQKSSLLVLGTSSLHDWEITAEKQLGTIEISDTDEFQIKNLNMSFDVEALKSGKSSMDKNTRKALDYDTYKTIDFKLIAVKSLTKIDMGFDIVATGHLTVSGTTKPIELKFRLIKENGIITLSGEKALKMTTFNVEPPKALLGTIKTGDDITIRFNTIFN